MKNIVYCLFCSLALLVGVVLTFGGGFSCACALVWWFALYLHGKHFPSAWKAFYRANLRILSRFDCL